jgi:hypothetical protein
MERPLKAALINAGTLYTLLCELHKIGHAWSTQSGAAA